MPELTISGDYIDDEFERRLIIDDEFEPCVRCGGGYDEMYFIDSDPVCADCITEKEKREGGYSDD